MEIPAWMFFFWSAIIGVLFLKLGFNAIDKTDLLNSVSPKVMFLFKHSLAIAVCHSSNYALIFRPLSHIPIHKYSTMVMLAIFVLLFFRKGGESFARNSLVYYMICFFVLLLNPVLNGFFHNYYYFVWVAFLVPLLHSNDNDSFTWYLTISISIYLLVLAPRADFFSRLEDKIGLGIYFTVESAVFLAGGKTKLFPMLILFIAFLTSAFWALFSADESIPTSVEKRILEKRIFSFLRKSKKVKLIEFGVGMAGTIIFQNFFRLSSLDQVLAFTYLAVAWLANLTLLRASFDFGIFNFLLSNAIVGCTMSQFGLGRVTWLVYGASLLLYGLRLKLESLFLVKRGGALVIGL